MQINLKFLITSIYYSLIILSFWMKSYSLFIDLHFQKHFYQELLILSRVPIKNSVRWQKPDSNQSCITDLGLTLTYFYNNVNENTPAHLPGPLLPLLWAGNNWLYPLYFQRDLWWSSMLWHMNLSYGYLLALLISLPYARSGENILVQYSLVRKMGQFSGQSEFRSTLLIPTGKSTKQPSANSCSRLTSPFSAMAWPLLSASSSLVHSCG